MRIITLFLFSLLFVFCTKNVSGQASSSDAQRKQVADKDKVWKPGDSPEGKAAKKAKKNKRKQVDPNVPLTKKELGKKMKQDEIDKNKNYANFHDRIQSKKVRKRMKENAKKSSSVNTGERPSFWRRMGIWFRKKK